MKSRFPAIVLGVLLSGAALAGGWKTFLSPGPVHQSHDEFAADCDSCHLVFDGIPDSRCLDCHEGLATRIGEKKGFHAEVEGACIDCHGDHVGLEGDLTKPAARDGFDHAKTGFDLHGAHGKVECETCHTGPVGEMQSSCATCHEDAHESALGPDCIACHVADGWNTQLKTLEAHSVATDGGHQGLACADCHVHGQHLDLDVPCAVCHDDAHDGSTSKCDQCHKVAGWMPAEFNHGPCTCAFPGKHQSDACLGCHEDFDFSDTPTLCSGCHTDERKHDDIGECSTCHTALSWSEDRFDHNKQSSFAIAGSHLEVSCAQCHTTKGQFGGAPTACASCHAEAGMTAHGDFGACETCHSDAGWSPSAFDHASTGFTLTGKHTETGCPACHGATP